MLRAILIFLICAGFTLNAKADEPINCTTESRWSSQYFRDIQHAEFNEEVNLKNEIRLTLIEHADYLSRVSNWEKEYSGPDSEYLPILIELLQSNAGLSHEFNCLWSLFSEGDIVRKFSDNERYVFRNGYGLFQNEKLSAYFYVSIAVE